MRMPLPLGPSSEPPLRMCAVLLLVLLAFGGQLTLAEESAVVVDVLSSTVGRRVPPARDVQP